MNQDNRHKKYNNQRWDKKRKYNNQQQYPKKEVDPETRKRNDKIIQKVKDWQNFKFIKPLTCNTEGCFTKFKAREINGRVVLQCPNCRVIQSYIPKAVLQTRFYISNVLRRIQSLYHSVVNFETAQQNERTERPDNR